MGERNEGKENKNNWLNEVKFQKYWTNYFWFLNTTCCLLFTIDHVLCFAYSFLTLNLNFTCKIKYYAEFNKLQSDDIIYVNSICVRFNENCRIHKSNCARFIYSIIMDWDYLNNKWITIFRSNTVVLGIQIFVGIKNYWIICCFKWILETLLNELKSMYFFLLFWYKLNSGILNHPISLTHLPHTQKSIVFK